MNLSDGEVIGMTSGDLDLQGSRIEAVVPLSAAAVQNTVADFTSNRQGAATEGVYLALESIRGVRDAVVLKVSLRAPAHAAAGRQQEFDAGSIGLYGLRRASLTHVGKSASGLGFVLDVSAFFESLSTASAANMDELIVIFQPNHELPADAKITIGCVRVFRRQRAAANPPP